MHLAPVTFDAAGLPTVGTPVSKSLIGGMIAKVSTVFDEAQIVIPGTVLEKLAVEAVPVALGAVGEKFFAEGRIGIPFTRS